jgi:hypothetical protein
VCVGVDDRVPGRYCEGACLFLGLVGWEALADWWTLRRVWTVLGEHLGDREVVEVFAGAVGEAVVGIVAVEAAEQYRAVVAYKVAAVVDFVGD